MPKTLSTAPAKKPAAAIGVKRTKTATVKASRLKTPAKKQSSAKKSPAKKLPAKTAPKKPKLAKSRPAKTKSPTPKAAAAAPEKRTPRPRAQVINDHPDNIVVDVRDTPAVAALARAAAKRERLPRKTRPPGDRIGDPLLPSEGSLVERVSDAIERELSKIERIVGNPVRIHPVQRVETESRARVLASLARTLKEVMRLRGETRVAGEGAEGKSRAADDDAVPRDLDEFRRELSRRLEGMVAAAAPIPDGDDE